MDDLSLVKTLRKETGVSFAECKKAVEEAGGNLEEARGILRKRGAQFAYKKADRSLGAGVIASYIHSDHRIGVLVELLSETDFVARNSEFRELADDIAMHVAAFAPVYLKEEDVNEAEREQVRKEFAEHKDVKTKPDEIRKKIIDGKTDAHFKEWTLMRQSFVKNSDITVRELIEDATQKLGEKIEISRFVRYCLLEE